MTRSEVARPHDGKSAEVDRAQEPSVGWGWHGGFPHGSLIAGWATVVIFVAILVSRLVSGHTEGHVPDVYLTVICAGTALSLGRRTARLARHSWLR